MGKTLAEALLRPINPAGVVILGLYTILWGFWLTAPWWDVFSTAPLYDIMETLAPEWVWGVFAMLIGAVVVYAVLKQSYGLLTYSTALVGWHWAAVGIFYFIADWHNTGGITCLMLATYAAFVYLNHRVNIIIPMKEEKQYRKGLL